MPTDHGQLPPPQPPGQFPGQMPIPGQMPNQAPPGVPPMGFGMGPNQGGPHHIRPPNMPPGMMQVSSSCYIEFCVN